MKKVITFMGLLVLMIVMVGCDGNLITSEKYTVKFVTNTDLKISNQIVTKGEKVTKPTDPVKEGYIFDGWYVDDEKWMFDEYIVSSNITLTAMFISAKSLNVKNAKRTDNTFDLVLASATDRIRFKDYLEVKGYKECNIKRVTDETLFLTTDYIDIETGNTSFVILCTFVDDSIDEYIVNIYRKTQYCVVFELENSSVSILVEEGTIITDKNVKAVVGVLEKEGYRFNGWSYDFSNPVTSNLIVHPLWIKSLFYKIIYVVEGGSLPADAPQTFEGGIGVRLVDAIPNESNKIFLWWIDKETSTVYTKIDSNTYEDITLYAVFGNKENNKYEWKINQIGFQGKGMIYDIVVLPKEYYDPFDENYKGPAKEFRCKQQLLVEAAYDIIIRYVDWAPEAPWGIYRAEYINRKYQEGFGDAYVLNINSSWIPSLAKAGSIAELYDMNTDTGIFTKLSYDASKQSKEGYIQDDIINQATSRKGKVYAYTFGKARPDYFMYYNVDKVKSLDIEDPAELWMKGEWTMSKFKTWVNDARIQLSDKEYVLDMGFAESIIGFAASTGNAMATAYPAKLYLTNEKVISNIEYLQNAYNSGLYYERGVQDVSPGFKSGLTLLHHGELWFLKNSTIFDPLVMPFTIGVVPYPTADGEGGTPVTTTDASKAIKIGEDKYLTDANGNYIETVDMSSSTFKVPFIDIDCFAILNIENGKNGINSEIIMHIYHDLTMGVNANFYNKYINDNSDEHYIKYLETLFDREIDIEVIMSCNNNIYFELMEVLSMTVGNGSHFGDGGFWPLAISIVKNNASTTTTLNEVLPKYKQAMKDLGYVN